LASSMHLAGEHPVELLVVDAMRPFDFAVEPRRGWPDVDVLDAFVQEVPVEASLELGSIVGFSAVRRVPRISDCRRLPSAAGSCRVEEGRATSPDQGRSPALFPPGSCGAHYRARPLRAASNAACSSASSKTPEFHERSSWSFSDRAGGRGCTVIKSRPPVLTQKTSQRRLTADVPSAGLKRPAR
jgi:hypothetical protein